MNSNNGSDSIRMKFVSGVFVIREGQWVSQRVRTRIHYHKGNHRFSFVASRRVDCSRPFRTAIAVARLSKQFGVLSQRKIRRSSKFSLCTTGTKIYLWYPTPWKPPLAFSPLSTQFLPISPPYIPGAQNSSDADDDVDPLPSPFLSFPFLSIVEDVVASFCLRIDFWGQLRFVAGVVKL